MTNTLTEEERLKEWLTLISDIAYDYDGWRSQADLMDLIDELRGFAKKALNGEYVDAINPEKFMAQFMESEEERLRRRYHVE